MSLVNDSYKITQQYKLAVRLHDQYLHYVRLTAIPPLPVRLFLVPFIGICDYGQLGLAFLLESQELLALHDSQNEVDNDSSQKGNGQYAGTNSVIKSTLTTLPDTLCTPVEGIYGV